MEQFRHEKEKVLWQRRFCLLRTLYGICLKASFLGGEGILVSVPDTPLALVNDLATEGLCKRKFLLCKRVGMSGMFATWLL